VALPKTGRDYLSYSQLSTFQRCPLKWHLEYVERRPRESVAAGLVFGAAIHAGLEALHRALLAGAEPLDVDDLLAAYEQAWAEHTGPEVDFGPTETAASFQVLAEQMFAAFLNAPEAQADGGEILGVEEELRGRILPELPDLLARMDLLVQTEDALVIRDFKTARSRWNDAKVQEYAPQLLLYGELATPLAEELGAVPIRLEFVVLTKTKQPTVEIHPVPIDPFLLGRTQRTAGHIWQAMQAGHVYPNPSALYCAGCPFQQACRDWRG
jgi:RecB family exonuclease